MASQVMSTTQIIQDRVVSWPVVFWDSEGAIHVDFLSHGVTIKAQ
jgi:hypothetical protein